MRSCCTKEEHCVSAKEYRAVHRQWVGMCWLCVVLLASTAICGVLMLEYKQELVDTQHALDNATAREIRP